MKITNVNLYLVVISCLIGGTLAGGDIYRYIIEVPAWHHLNISNWEKYSEYADLGNGLILFPVQAIGSAVALIIASIISLRSKALHSTSWLLYTSTLFSIIGLALTFFAAPIMLNLPNVASDSALIQQSFIKFHYWGMLRAIAQVLSFIFAVFVLSSMNKTR